MSDLEKDPQQHLILQESPPWNRPTKTIVVVVSLLLVSIVAWRFQDLIAQIVTAAVLAYVLDPVIKFLERNTPLRRGVLVLLVYLVLVVLVIGASAALGVAAYGQINNFINELPRLVNQVVGLVRSWAEEAVSAIGPFELTFGTLDWTAIRSELLSILEPLLSQSGQYARQLASATLRVLGNFLFILVVSIYLALEIPRLGEYVGRVAQQPGYRRDAERLMREFGKIWSAYLRGQIILGLVIGVTVGVSLAILGVQNALALGLLSGLLEFIPVIGPVIGAVVAIVVAFFQPENYLGLGSLQYALLVLAVMIIIQQLENNLLVPRIVGEALDLHPLLVIVGVFMGSSLAGILGAILAAPVLATIKLLGVYAWRKMFDLPPFPVTDSGEDSLDSLSWSHRVRNLWRRLRAKENQADPDAHESGGI